MSIDDRPRAEEPDTGAATPPKASRRFEITAPRVFWPALIVIGGFVILALAAPEWTGELFTTLSNTVVKDLGWYYILIVSGFIAFSLWAAIGPTGRVVLGQDDEKPEFGLVAWFSMLFAAGMGIGLVFWGVAEPLSHFASPPPGTGDTAAERARAATDVTYLHWGLHAWGIYVVVGLAVAYAVHRKGRPVSIRWALEPLLGPDRVKGALGDVIDVIAVVGTLFGVATSLGFGVSQVASGMQFLGAVSEVGNVLLVVLIVVITGFATLSVATGIDKGIKILSNVNMIIAAGLMLFVLFAGATVFILEDFVSSVGSYVSNFFRLSFQTLSFEGEDGTAWVSGWTTFYWGWWMSWAPFVGVFIARISKGRTVREFVAGVLLVPTAVTFLWFAIFGGSGIYREIFGGGGLIGVDGVDTTSALFQLLDGFPLATLTSIVAIVLVVIFFVTSSDSGSYVVDMLSSGGDPNPPVWSRVMWALLEGAVAVSLLLAGGGGLSALQTAAILLALPFSLVMIGMVLSLGRALLREHGRMEHAERGLLADEIAHNIARRDDHLGALARGERQAVAEGTGPPPRGGGGPSPGSG